MMKENIHLILFFDIYTIIKLSKFCKIDADATTQSDFTSIGASSVEREVQTDLHPVPCYKDSNYVWNLWDFRRKAIELVRIFNYKKNKISFKNCLLILGKSSS